MVESLPITKYNFSKNFPAHGTFCAIGRRGSGKSKCLIDVMYQLRDRFDFGIAFTTTTPMAEALYEIMPRACVFKTFSTERIKLLLEEQERLIAKKKPRSLFLLLDDCGFDLKSMNSMPMKELFMNGRHKLITFLCALQFPHQLKPDMRMQIDTVVALKENQVSNRKRIYEAFFGVISSWHDFERLFSGFTSDYGALIVDQTVQSNDITKVVFHYKACIDLPPFVCISRKYIKIWENVKKSQAEVSRLREEQIVQQRRRQTAEAARTKGEKIRVTHTAVSANNGDPDSKIVVTN
tara:strand:+ start:833 stop:1714 length:882 start_codon:yes stop_codon:yes gene_type:complete